ncbi:MAG: GTPase domain-containing protein [Methylococcales symbiont of Hymedesmia sp. n. MRB-2018]|nr:MAG: GTPase domain-containing protein [Methylococcales symbiont of Hymedesmia sp. n. MRB-2018]KAF3982749.1 MAG: GTPase domain-containing protein [Methylococcales symbiont of Hymedesmia sp. n. MRB-2018]
MLEFIQLLNQRYQAVRTSLNNNDPRCLIFQQRIEQLLLMEAFIRKGILIDSDSKTPLQIAILGPTQTGKSTVSNLILNSHKAGISPLAGYTAHPQGFCYQTTLSQRQGLQSFYGRFQQVSQSELNNERYDCYSLTESNEQTRLLPSCVFWDTPDFDSIDSADYREGVIRTIALADIVVLVVSKEKYADQSVWEMMSTIELFHQPSVICVNKLIAGNEEIIIRSLKDKWLQARTDEFPSVIPLYYQKQTAMPVWPASENKLFFQLQKKVSLKKHFVYEREILNKYWHNWLDPIVIEHEMVKTWHTLVDKNIEQIIQEYQRDFLDHPHYYNTFQNALIELLNLLEIPGISRIITKTRRVLTWPIRKIFGIGRKPKSALSQEEAILAQLGEHLLIQLADQLLEKIDTDGKQNKWWNDCYCRLRQQRNEILEDYQQSINQYCTTFQQDVDATANKLYHKLAEQPIILNSLRATRASTDAAAMALMIATGGIGVHDLVITPAMLSITSMLTESAIGSHLKGVKNELKQHQMEVVKKDLFIACLKHALSLIPEQLSETSGFNISIEQVQQAESQRKEKKHGIRLL